MSPILPKESSFYGKAKGLANQAAEWLATVGQTPEQKAAHQAQLAAGAQAAADNNAALGDLAQYNTGIVSRFGNSGAAPQASPTPAPSYGRGTARVPGERGKPQRAIVHGAEGIVRGPVAARSTSAIAKANAHPKKGKLFYGER
jgi:hypothetical protein